jgi:hypothetical protein
VKKEIQDFRAFRGLQDRRDPQGRQDREGKRDGKEKAVRQEFPAQLGK